MAATRSSPQQTILLAYRQQSHMTPVHVNGAWMLGLDETLGLTHIALAP